MARPQQIRRTQFLTTYGPGAIVETQGGPRMMLMPGPGLFDLNHLIPINFEIAHPALAVALGGRVYKLPSNEELGRPPGRAIYRTRPFPVWKRCPDDSLLYVRRCPRCSMSDRGEAVRFVVACDNGHTDDLDWVGLVHAGTARCETDHLEWLGGGGTLSEVRIRCPVCGSTRSLGDIYYRELRCSGRHPEQEADGQAVRSTCPRPARVIHRGAVNLYIPHVLSILVIPPFDMPPWSLLLHPAMQNALVGIAAGTDHLDAARIRAAAQDLAARGHLPMAHAEAIGAHNDDELVEAAEEVLTDPVPADFPAILRKEFRALRVAARQGAPPSPPRRGVLPGFEVRLADVREVVGPSGIRFRVAPVSRLRVILAQKGYSRLSPDSPLVDTAYLDADGRWYPGIDRQGEGIFVEALDPIAPSGPAAKRWQHARAAISGSDPYLFRNPADPEEADPVFVWWHTFAHRLITALGVDSGMSSTGIRERVYVERNRDGVLVGGILLHAIQPGGDGTHGGLIALVPEFDRILQGALVDIDVCSNDPFCASRHPGPDRRVGAACYSCLFVSETSCDHRNLWLDRAVLLEALP